jgi:hypothetical protein
VGLYFLYLGLSAITQLLGSDLIENPDKTDVVNGLLPVVFDLAVGWWLLGGGLLVRRAYSESSRPAENLPSQIKRTAPSPEPAPSAGLTGMEQAEKKLAALVEKPK